MRIRDWALVVPAFMVVAACGMGEPATKAKAEEVLKEKMADDDWDVTWINAVPKEEAGEFRVYLDRVKKSDPEATQTKVCNASVSSNSHSYSCGGSIEPSVLKRSAETLIEDYASRNLEVRDIQLKRTGEGNAIGGFVDVVNPGDGQVVKVPCKGTQDEGKYNVNCDLSYGEEGAS